MKKILCILNTFLIVLSMVLGYTVYAYKQKSKTRLQVYIPIDNQIFQEKLAKTPPDWMVNQIHSDLSAYEKNGISKKELDQFFQGETIETLNLIRFSIRDRKISFSLSDKNLEHKQFRHVLAAIQKLNELTPLPNVDFIMSMEDGFDTDVGIPLFVYAKKADTAPSLVLMPDFKALTGYPGLRSEIPKAGHKWRWENKINKAFWRGASTGGWLTIKNWDQIPRVKLSIIGHSHPEKMDASLVGVVQSDPEISALIESKGLVSSKVSQADHLKYKYLIDVDGNSCSYERYFWTLLSNSVVLKQITPNIQWYYRALQPYEHFVPVKEDLSDLLEKIEWVQTHDKEAQKIAQNATSFIENELTYEDVFVYMAHLLKEYAKYACE